jgi:hypothetical protein
MSSVTVKQDRGPTGLAGVLKARVDLWLVVALMAMSFGAGVVVKTLSEPPAAPAISTTQTGGLGTVAPPLTQDQISNGLPSDHPDFTEGGGGQGQGGGNGQGAGQGQSGGN